MNTQLCYWLSNFVQSWICALHFQVTGLDIVFEETVMLGLCVEVWRAKHGPTMLTIRLLERKEMTNVILPLLIFNFTVSHYFIKKSATRLKIYRELYFNNISRIPYDSYQRTCAHGAPSHNIRLSQGKLYVPTCISLFPIQKAFDIRSGICNVMFSVNLFDK